MPHPNRKRGWWFDVGNGALYPCDLNIVEYNNDLFGRRLRFNEAGKILEVIEHIMPLRFTGLDSIVFSCPTSLPPYSGNAFYYWERLKPFLVEEAGYEIPWFEIKEPTFCAGKRKVSITPLNKLEIEVNIAYKDFGSITKTISLNDSVNLENIFKARTQAWYFNIKVTKILFYISKFWIFLRPFAAHECLCWPTHKENLDEFAKHRILDILGILALIKHDQLPMLRYISRMAGHKQDLKTLRLIESNIKTNQR